MSFTEFGFDERIQKGIDEAGFLEPTPVQSQCFDLLVKQNRDVYAQSQTGSGKTAAFLLGIFQLMLKSEKYQDSKALVIVPTRELAVQIQDEAKRLGRHTDISAGAVFGGSAYGPQEKMLREGVDILMGTPGRLIDFNSQAKIDFADYDFLVIDEADRLFDMGFIGDLRKIIKRMKPNTERCTMLFSATLSARVGNLAWEYMSNPGEVIIEPEKVTVDTVIQELYHVGKDEKMKLLLGLLGSENPANAVIFTNTRHMAWEIRKRLEVNGFEGVISMAGDVPQSRRLKIVDELKRGQHKYMVATDVAARGLHVDELQMVINYDVPLEPEGYVHRVGRTARAGKSGKTITLACEQYVYGLPPIEKLLGSKIPVKWADDSLIVPDKSEGMKFTGQVRQRELRNEERESAFPSRGKKSPQKKGQFPPSHSKSGKLPSQKTEHKPETRLNKKQINRRTSNIQSTVSMVVGRNVADGEKPKNVDSASSAGKPVSGRARPGTAKKSASIPSRSRSGGARNVDSGSKVTKRTKEERLAYYEDKYGESFQKQSGRSFGNRKNKKQGSTSDKGKKSAAASSDSGLRSRSKNQTQAAAPSKDKHRSSSNTQTISSSKDRKASTALPQKPEMAKPKKKKGLLGFLFGK